MMKIYVEAKSKNDIHARIDAGEDVQGRNYSMFAPATGSERHGMHTLDDNLLVGTVICTYTKMVGDNPVSKYWYTWDGTRCK
tara:strand:- start:145 stop:390 length:246 start_codon:yes stop_codon:yes gene_type:complete